MANQQIGNHSGVTAVGGKNRNGGNDGNAGLVLTNQVSIAAMRTRLAAINPNSYTQQRLDTMTYNDLVYALRVHDAAGSIK